MNDYRPIETSDVNEGMDEEMFKKIYGDNNGNIEYGEDGSIILDEDNAIPIFDRSERSYENGYTVYLTVKGYTNQDPNDSWGPCTIFAMSSDQDTSVVNRLCWVGVRKNNLQVFSYYNEVPPRDCDYEYEKDGFISKDISSYSNKIMNIQITGRKDDKTNIYINGELFKSFNSGTGNRKF